ncbi:MAG: glycosyltransferase, partial [Saprospiraceae bacterium]|nr:glycosyltransferase [Saprospiraceae bacterium]
MFFEDLITYWREAGLDKIVRIFWYFILFELLRYVLVDYIVVFFYFLSKSLNRKKWDKARNDLFAEYPLVSIIVPGKNEGKHIFKLTRSLAEQTYRNYEIIVVDDGSDDQTRVIGRDLEKRGLIDLFISNEVRGGKASGANI